MTLLISVVTLIDARQHRFLCRGRHCNDEQVQEKEVFTREEDTPIPPGFDPTFDAARCKSDDDGYVGSTNGHDTIVFYTVGIETVPNADMGAIFEAVEKRVEVTLLRRFFPGLCTVRGGGGRNLRYGINGLRFITGFEGGGASYPF